MIAAAAAGCQAPALFEDRRALALRLAEEAGFALRYVEAGRFTLLSFHKGRPGASPHLVVYIEGDGYAWQSRYVLSRDPTPLDPIGLRLARRDPAPNVVYFARPCQYVTGAKARGCLPAYWATHRYAGEVIEAINLGIDSYKSVYGAETIGLVGYSGGGAVAALVAARRADVVALTTVAGDLDHAAWTAYHNLQPLVGSLNPADFAARLAPLDQVHLVGADDDVVPPAIVEAYAGRMADRSHTRIVVITDFAHVCCWERDWPQLRARYRLVRR